MIKISDEITLNEKDIKEEFIKASGPGGQNVNKLSTAVKLFFNVKETATLSVEIKTRLIKLSGSRITDQGVLIIHAKRFRSQDRNRKDAFERLKKLLLKAAQKPKTRRKTKPTKAAIEKRLQSKKKKSDLKKSRNAFSKF